jgi:hypothetical protein
MAKRAASKGAPTQPSVRRITASRSAVRRLVRRNARAAAAVPF